MGYMACCGEAKSINEGDICMCMCSVWVRIHPCMHACICPYIISSISNGMEEGRRWGREHLAQVKWAGEVAQSLAQIEPAGSS